TGISSFHAFRSSVSVLKRYLGVHASFQYNPYTLNELRYLRSNASFRQYAVGPYTEFEAFNQKVQFRLYGNLFYNTHREIQSLSANGQMNWKISPFWSLQLAYYQSQSSYLYLRDDEVDLASMHGSNQLRLGINKV